MATRLAAIVIDACDPTALGAFWAHALGFSVYGEQTDHETVVTNPPWPIALLFIGGAEPKVGKNRIHLDLACASFEEQRQKVDALIELGASRIDIGQPDDATWVVMADPEGNEFCVSPPAELFTDTGPIGAISFDGSSPALGRFWSEATGWPVVYERGDYVGLRAQEGGGPLITFGPPVAQKRGKNRWHFDVRPFATEGQEAEVERLRALGARRMDIGQADVPWVVMADPEGNELCVLPPL